MPMPNRLFTSRLHIDGFQGQGNFDELFAVGHRLKEPQRHRGYRELSVEEAFDAVFEDGDVEVDQEAKAEFFEFEVGE